MTRQIKVGGIKMGGGSPIVIQSMVKTGTQDITATVKQIKELEDAGCELVRLAIKDIQSADAVRLIKKKINIPICADVHFDHRLALRVIDNGIDKIRLNPGNIYKEEEIIKIAKLAKKNKVPIRVGVNSGSVKKDEGRETIGFADRRARDACPPKPWRRRKGRRTKDEGRNDLADVMVEQALDYIKILERADFYKIVVSLKASDVLTTIDAYRRFSKESDYPLHLGITAAGPLTTGLIKSSIGIGVLLLEGIGDTIRVSLTDNPCKEVVACQNILQALKLRYFRPEIISCPTCGRCQVDLQRIVRDVEREVTQKKRLWTMDGGRGMKIAIMGCEVNGPGEAKDADIGVACGKNAGAIFKKGKIVKRVKEKEIVKELVSDLIYEMD